MRRFLWVLVFAVLISVMENGCKKDDENPVTPGGGGIATFNFTTSNQTFTVPSTGGAAKAKLTGGTLPYSITSAPDPGVANAYLSTDTLTVAPVAAGSTSITITDSNPENQDNPRVVTIGITVTGGGTGGYGSGTVTDSSTIGLRSFTGVGAWPPGAGPSVLAVYDTLARTLFMLGYRKVSGTHYDFALVVAVMPTGPATGTYVVGQGGFFQVGYNSDIVDTTSIDTTSYLAVSGGVTVSTVSGSNVVGRYSGTSSLRGTTPIPMSGSFNAIFVNGRVPAIFGEDAPALARALTLYRQKQRRQ